MKEKNKYDNFENKIADLSETAILFLDLHVNGTWIYNKGKNIVNIQGSLNASSLKLENLYGINFGVISGDFMINDNNIKNLKGGPREVKGTYNCQDNPITSLEGIAQEIGRDLYISNTLIDSFEGIENPIIQGDLYCNGIKFRTLAGLPKNLLGKIYTDTFVWPRGHLNVDWIIENEWRYPILNTAIMDLLTPDKLEYLIQENPGKAIVTLKGVWKDIKKDKRFKNVKIPDYLNEMGDSLGTLNEFGL